MKYSIQLHWDENEKIWMASVPDLPGCLSHGATLSEATEMITEATELWLKVAKDHSHEIPTPGSCYGREIVRLVTEEAAKGTSHKKVLEPLCNMVASVLAGIKQQHNVDDRLLFMSQLDKMFDQYMDAYEAPRSS